MPGFAYNATLQLNDGSEELLDLEQRGWADKEMLARTVRFSLIPKDEYPGYPVVVVNVPEGAKPVFKTRVYSPLSANDGDLGSFVFRVYAIGYKMGRRHFLAWIMPGGRGIELTEDNPWLADIHINHLMYGE